MRTLWKIRPLLLSIALLGCEESISQQDLEIKDQTDTCVLLITKLTKCVGAVPALIGECNPETAQLMIDLPCEDLLRELGVR